MDFLLNENSSLKIFYLMKMNKRKGFRSCSVHSINKIRKQKCELNHLYKELRRDSVKFQKYFRMKIDTFDYVLDKIKNKLITNWTNFNKCPINVDERLAITIRFLTTGSSYKSLGFSFRMGPSTVSKIVVETITAIWEILQPIHMKDPTESTFREIANEFYLKWNFPNCLGSIDGKHIRVKCPVHSGCKNSYSIVLQAVADANYKFVTIDVGEYGKQSNGGTFKASSLYNLMESGRLNIPPGTTFPSTAITVPYVFIGGEAYPLLRNLLKPYSKNALDAEKEYFNMRLSWARRTVECAFGVISAKFRLLCKPIETSPETAEKIIKAICILHNTIIDNEGFDGCYEEIISKLPNISGTRHNNRPTNSASLVREAYKIFLCKNRI
ncbi:uncharacterized protein LOC118735488 [Rhagoletis pomonella]|uniref:uncharacterized protein LOC118735488 n=1 Tax=Rhagoletis pomonella TaxID=28610 RepID=UPI0017854798|nr:uncharacterized protein LOC118735488 [Rhagoletis pomonella]